MPVQDNDDKRTADQPSVDAEEELRRQQAAKQEHQAEASSVQKSGKLLPFLNAKAERHQSRIDTLDSKIATQQDKIANHKGAIERLTDKADRLEDKNRMLEATLGNLPLVRKFIESNQKKIADIRDNKIPAREHKAYGKARCDLSQAEPCDCPERYDQEFLPRLKQTAP